MANHHEKESLLVEFCQDQCQTWFYRTTLPVILSIQLLMIKFSTKISEIINNNENKAVKQRHLLCKTHGSD